MSLDARAKELFEKRKEEEAQKLANKMWDKFSYEQRVNADPRVQAHCDHLFCADPDARPPTQAEKNAYYDGFYRDDV